MRQLQLNRVYKHFKGNYYIVLDIVLNADDLKRYVLYKQLYEDGKSFIREEQEFLSKVDKIKYPNVKQKYRFELQEIEKVNKIN